MAEDNAAPTAPVGNAGSAPVPSFNLATQYIRDLSFENPGAPGSNVAGGASPSFSVGINVAVKKQETDAYAVELQLNAKAQRDATVLFNVELVYGGVFRLKNVPEAQLAPLLMVECPRLLFPFARHVLSSTVQQGGFPPLMLDPVDFQALYIQNLQRLQAQQAKAAAPSSPVASAPAGDGKLKN